MKINFIGIAFGVAAMVAAAAAEEDQTSDNLFVSKGDNGHGNSMNKKRKKKRKKEKEKEKKDVSTKAKAVDNTFDTCAHADPTLAQASIIINKASTDIMDDDLALSLIMHAKKVNEVYESAFLEYITINTDQDDNDTEKVSLAIHEYGHTQGLRHPSNPLMTSDMICNQLHALFNQMAETCFYNDYKFAYAQVAELFMTGFVVGLEEKGIDVGGTNDLGIMCQENIGSEPSTSLHFCREFPDGTKCLHNDDCQSGYCVGYVGGWELTCASSIRWFAHSVDNSYCRSIGCMKDTVQGDKYFGILEQGDCCRGEDSDCLSCTNDPNCDGSQFTSYCRKSNGLNKCDKTCRSDATISECDSDYND